MLKRLKKTRVKLYVDDVRPAPDGWTRAYTYEEAIEFLQTGSVTHLDLDWNLGQGKDKTGITILEWLTRALVARRIPRPEITVHNADPRARAAMLRMIAMLQ